MQEQLRIRALLVRHDLLGVGVASAGIAFVVAVALAFVRLDPGPLVLAPVLLFAGLAVHLLRGLFRNSWRRERVAVTVRASARGLWTEEAFLPASRIVAVMLDAGPGREPTVRIAVGNSPWPLEIVVSDARDGERLVQVLRAALEPASPASPPDAYARGELGTEAEALARGALSFDAWVGRLRALGAGAGASHRTAPLPPDRLLAMVESPSAPLPLRVAAALALGPRLDPRAAVTGAARLRDAVEMTSATAREARLTALLAEVEREGEAE